MLRELNATELKMVSGGQAEDEVVVTGTISGVYSMSLEGMALMDAASQAWNDALMARLNQAFVDMGYNPYPETDMTSLVTQAIETGEPVEIPGTNDVIVANGPSSVSIYQNSDYIPPEPIAPSNGYDY